MAITIRHDPSPLLVGPAANLAGQGELARYQQQQALREQQMALQEQAFAEQQRQNDFRNQFAQQQLGLSAYQFDVSQANRYWDAQRARQAQLAGLAMQQRGNLNELAMRGQVAQQGMWGDLAQQQMANEARLQLEQMEQQGLGQRLDQTMQGQLELQRRAALAKQATNDWMMIQRELPNLDQEQQAELIGQFQDRYASLDMPMPISVPQEAAQENPFSAEAVLGRLQQDPNYQGLPLYLTPDGDLMMPRGLTPEMTPQGQAMKQQEQEVELQKEQQKQELAAQQKRQEGRAKYAEAMSKAREMAEKTFVREIPGAKDPMGNVGPSKIERDEEGYDNYMRAQTIINRGSYLDPPVGMMVGDAPLPPIPPQYQGYTWVLSQEEIDALPPGTAIVFWTGSEWQAGIADPMAKAQPAAPSTPSSSAPAQPAASALPDLPADPLASVPWMF